MRVLIVDDDSLMLRSLERSLRDFDVVALREPTEALARIIDGERFDAIVSDMMMPAMTGAALHDAIRRVDGVQADAMIFMTGGATTDETHEFLSTTRLLVLRKPFRVDALRAALRGSARAP